MIYSFKCKCGLQTEVELSIHDSIINPICTDCHETMARVWDTPAITFKGKGFYKTDNPK
jgi:predicted nucleic acid-binding Zn ribbon protein